MKIKIFTINDNLIKPTFVGKIMFSELVKIAKLTYREDDNESFFQRPTDENRVNNIVNFITSKLFNGRNIKKQSDIISLFPTAIILAIDIDDAHLEGDYLILDNEECAFIVDGQHRFVGIKSFYEKNDLRYEDLDLELPITILYGYDFFEQSRIFLNVNFEQRKVNKSFYFDIFGSLPDGRSDMQLAHLLAKRLNSIEESPFYEMIRMLGVGNGIFSQAFFVQSLMDLFRPNKIFSELYYDFINKKDSHKKIAEILIIYFSVIKNTFIDYYPKKDSGGKYSFLNQDILFKTTGLGALFKLLNDFKSHIDFNNMENARDTLKKKFDLVSQSQAKRLFGRDGDFAKGAGAGLQSKLYLELKEIIGLN